MQLFPLPPFFLISLVAHRALSHLERAKKTPPEPAATTHRPHTIIPHERGDAKGAGGARKQRAQARLATGRLPQQPLPSPAPVHLALLLHSYTPLSARPRLCYLATAAMATLRVIAAVVLVCLASASSALPARRSAPLPVARNHLDELVGALRQAVASGRGEIPLPVLAAGSAEEP